MRQLFQVRVANRLYSLYDTDPPGVVNGVCEDPQAYFFWLIQRQPGQPADDWNQVLTMCGLPAGYPPHTVPTDNGYYGLTQQIRSGGEVAGRIFLPTAQPDPNGYYSHPVSPLADAPQGGGHLLWEWRSLGGPPYVPINTSGSGGGGGSTSGLTEERVQEMIDTSIESAVAGFEGITFGAKIALRTNSGLLAGIAGGGPTSPDTPINWIGKTGDAHAWESFTIEKGE